MPARILSFIFLFFAVNLLSASEPVIRENSFQSDCPIIRAERPFQFSVIIENGNSPDISCRLILPEDGSTRTPCDVNRETSAAVFSWDVVCAESGQKEFSLELLKDGEIIQKNTISQIVLPPREIEKLEYIPEPKPVKTDILVGAHNCPLWEADRAELWNQVVKKHQERTPALGIYSQDHPELADWETKWAVEHGVSFFIYCWYRTTQGGAITTRFEKSVFDDALFLSKFGDQMKFTIMWENQHRGFSGIADENDLLENLLPYWIEKFFRRENYLKIDNKPVLFVYVPTMVSDDLGGDENARIAFDKMREACREAGFDGLYILGEYRGGDQDVITRFRNLGLDASFAYCWHVWDSPPPEAVIRDQQEKIRKIQSMRDILPTVITLSQAWSGWQDEGSIWKLPPEDFETLLRWGKDFIAETMEEKELGARMIILDNWNEWSEGHYIAPYREYGFGYLDAVRRVFSDSPEEHEDLLPEDIGMGPYSLPAEYFKEK